MVQLSHPYRTTRKTIALTIWTFVSKVMSLLFNTHIILWLKTWCSCLPFSSFQVKPQFPLSQHGSAVSSQPSLPELHRQGHLGQAFPLAGGYGSSTPPVSFTCSGPIWPALQDLFWDLALGVKWDKVPEGREGELGGVACSGVGLLETEIPCRLL